MKITALVGFSGVLTMAAGETREYDNDLVIQDLLEAGYIEIAKPDPKSKSTTKKG